MADGRHSAPGSVLLWAAALAVTLTAAAWQWWTDPTPPREGEVVISGTTVRYSFLRSGVVGEPLRVAIAAPADLSGTLRWRPHPGDEPFGGITMLHDGEELFGLLPPQPPGGQLEYSVVLAGPSGLTRIPEEGPVVMRYRGRVPRVLFLSHVVFIFLSMLIGVRAGLGALWTLPDTFFLSRVTLASITIGGMILGPIVQKFALDAFWASWPLGDEPIGTKTLVLWLAWVAAVVAVAATRDKTDRFARTLVVAAAAVTVVVFFLPPALHGR
ncbi:MAG: hypothetical protein PVJ73_04220 [Acidobacteriota bacterium]